MVSEETKTERKQKRNRSEQNFCTELQKWMRSCLECSCAWEAKIVVGELKYNLRLIPDHQFTSLRRASKGSFCYKISDAECYTQKPCDGVFITMGKGIFFFKWIRRNNKRFYGITVECLENFMSNGNFKLSEDNAIEMAIYVVN